MVIYKDYNKEDDCSAFIFIYKKIDLQDSIIIYMSLILVSLIPYDQTQAGSSPDPIYAVMVALMVGFKRKSNQIVGM